MKTTGNNCGNGSLPPAVLVDFDDTAAEQNVAELLLKRFGDPTWQDVRERLMSRDLTLKEYQEIVFRNIQADRATMQGYVKNNASLRPYFGELWSYCRSNDFPMAIVSLGLDFYIEALLEKEGFHEVPVFAVNTEFTPQGIQFEYRHARPGRERQGISKGLVVDRFRERGHCIFYAGDGMSDFEAADRADVLFAHRILARECSRRDIPFHPFTDFKDVLLAVQAHTSNGLKPDSPSTATVPPGPQDGSR